MNILRLETTTKLRNYEVSSGKDLSDEVDITGIADMCWVALAILGRY